MDHAEMPVRTLAAGAWDRPAEAALDAYLAERGDAVADEDATRLRAALRAEPLARGCPSLAMLTRADLEGIRRHIAGSGPDGAAVLGALRAFLAWAGASGLHRLPPEDVDDALEDRRSMRGDARA
ncbi:MAG: hypothetical protein WD734_06975 [Dehalococcoidia bacterium]